MKPLIHHVFTIKDGRPYKKIKTIIGKAKFKSWAIKHYFEGTGEPICFQVEGWDSEQYVEALPFWYLNGKRKGEPRLLFPSLRKSADSDDDLLRPGGKDDIPF